MKPNLNDKTALISGAAQGIGRAIAIKFHEAGARLILVDNSKEKLDQLVAEIGHEAVACAVDISNAEDLTAHLHPILARQKTLDILVNNAATVTRRTKITELSLDEWQKTLAVNLTGTFLLSKTSIPAMQRAGGGVIMNIASQLGHVGIAGAAPYCTTKGGILQFTRCLALDHAEDNIRVVALSPGAVLTPRLTGIYGTADDAEQALAKLHPIGRLGDVDEIAKAALFLVSEDASFITGTDLVADGGYIAR